MSDQDLVPDSSNASSSLPPYSEIDPLRLDQQRIFDEIIKCRDVDTHVIDLEWFRKWELYVTDLYAESPGQITNNHLREKETGLLRASLELERDYLLLSARAFEQLKTWFTVDKEILVDELRSAPIDADAASAASALDALEATIATCELPPPVIALPYHHSSDTTTSKGADADSSAYPLGSLFEEPTVGPLNRPTGSGYSSYYRSDTDVPSSGLEQPGICGLANLGNTCYMNAALQCLSHIPPLSAHLVSGRYATEVNVNNPLGHGGELAHAYAEVLTRLWSGEYKSVAPHSLKYALGKASVQFAGYGQQDSQELLTFLLDGLNEDLNRVLKKPYVESVDQNNFKDDLIGHAHEAWTRHLLRNQSIIIDNLCGQFKSTVQCAKCSTVSVTFDAFTQVSVPVPVPTTRTIEVTVLSRKFTDPIVHCYFQVPKQGTMMDLKLPLGEKFGVTPGLFLIVEVFSERIHMFFEDQVQLNKVGENDTLVAYLLAGNSVAYFQRQQQLEAEDAALLAAQRFTPPSTHVSFKPSSTILEEDDDDPSIHEDALSRPMTNNPQFQSFTSINQELPVSSSPRGAGTTSPDSSEGRAPSPVAAATELTSFHKHLSDSDNNTTGGDGDSMQCESVDSYGAVGSDRDRDYDDDDDDSDRPAPAKCAKCYSLREKVVVHVSCKAAICEECMEQTRADCELELMCPVCNQIFVPTTEARASQVHIHHPLPPNFISTTYATAGDDSDSSVNSDDDSVRFHQFSQSADNDDEKVPIIGAAFDHYTPTVSNYGYRDVSAHIQVPPAEPDEMEPAPVSCKERYGLVPDMLRCVTLSFKNPRKPLYNSFSFTLCPRVISWIGPSTGAALYGAIAEALDGLVEPRDYSIKFARSHYSYQRCLHCHSQHCEGCVVPNDHHFLEFDDFGVSLMLDPEHAERLKQPVYADRLLFVAEQSPASIAPNPEQLTTYVLDPDRPSHIVELNNDMFLKSNRQLDPIQVEKLTLNDCFSSFTKEETLSENDYWYCPHCKEHQSATKQMELWKTPDVLIVHLKRFLYDNGARVLVREKIEEPVLFPLEDLNVANFVSLGSPFAVDALYDCFAVVNHSGSLGGGHYTAYALHGDGWYMFDDRSTYKVEARDVVSPRAYVMMYRKKHLAWDYSSIREPLQPTTEQVAVQLAETTLHSPPEAAAIIDTNPSLSEPAAIDSVGRAVPDSSAA